MACLVSMSSRSLHITRSTSNDNTNDTSSSLQPRISVQTNNVNAEKSMSLPKKKRRKPTVAEIERAISAGRFRNANPKDLEEEVDVEFDLETMSFPGKFEGSVERRLRETGEWMVDNTEKKFRNSGKTILKITYFWIMPIWVLLVLIAGGVIKLPFSNEYIDQLIM